MMTARLCCREPEQVGNKFFAGGLLAHWIVEVRRLDGSDQGSVRMTTLY